MKMPHEFTIQHRFPLLRKVMLDPSLVFHFRDSKKLLRELSLFLKGQAVFYSTKCLDDQIIGKLGKKGLIPERKLIQCLHSKTEFNHLECLKRIFGKHNPDNFVWATKDNVNAFEQTSGLPIISATDEGHFFFCPPSRFQRAYANNINFAAKISQRNAERKASSHHIQNQRKKHSAR